MEYFNIKTHIIDTEVQVNAISFTLKNVISTLSSADCIEKTIVKRWLDNYQGYNEVIFISKNLTHDGYLILQDLLNLDKNLTWLCLNYELYYIKIKYNSVVFEFRCLYKLLAISDEKLQTFFWNNGTNSSNLHQTYTCIANTKYHKDLQISSSDFSNETAVKNFYLCVKNYSCSEKHVIMLKTCVEIFIKKFKILGINLKNKYYSASSISTNYYFKNFNLIEKKLPTVVENYIKPAYYGGRCEVFGNAKTGEIILHHDYAGMYSQCMLEKFPHGSWKIKYLKKISEAGFYNIKYISNMDIPILPIRIDKLYFMNGEMSGTYWFEEIELFKENGGIILEINYAIIFEKYTNVLAEFINTLEQFKRSDEISKMVGKLLINSFYGRLGMGKETFRSFISNHDNHNEYTPYLNNLVIFKEKMKRDTIGNVAVAAAITSKARIKLYRSYLAVLKWKGRLLYSDTDSIIAAFKSKEAPLDIDIGGLIFNSKKWDTKINKAVFVSGKTYSVVLENGVEITKIKGVRTNAITFNYLYENFYNNNKIVIEDQIIYSKKHYSIDKKQTTKTIDLANYSKRIFSKDKKYTTPRNY